MEYQVIFITFFGLTILLMKLIGSYLYKATYSERIHLVFMTPFFTSRSLKRLSPNSTKKSVKSLSRLVLFTVLAVTLFKLYKFTFDFFNVSNYLKSYLLIWFIYLATNIMSYSAQVLNFFSKRYPEDMHSKPYTAKNISEFWALRWNHWIRDWLHLMGKTIVPSSPSYRLLVIFFLSGLFHECMFNLPYSLYNKTFFFGSMLLFFFIQFLAVLIDKNFLRKLKYTRRAFMWIALITPSPLFINKPLFQFFGF